MDTYIWLGLMVLFVIVEAACPIHLVSIWFAMGSLAALIVSAHGAGLGLQTTIFVVVSAGLLAALWPLTKKFLNPKTQKTNIDSIIGSECHVLTDIDNIDATGQVKLNGMEWSARSSDGSKIQKGALVKVDRIEGVKVYVSPVSE